MRRLLSTVFNIVGGILVGFIFFITADNLSTNLGLNSPLVPVVISTVIVSIALEQKIVDAVFPLIGIGFYLLVGLMIMETDVLYGSYSEVYGVVLLAVSIIAFVIWVIYYIIILIMKELLSQARQRFGEVVMNVFQIMTVAYVVFRFFQIKRNILFGLTGTAAISIHILLLIHDIEYILLDLSSFAIASLVALLPFHIRNTHKKSKRVRSGVDFRSNIHSLREKLPNPTVPRPWRNKSTPIYSIPKRTYSRCKTSIGAVILKIKAIAKLPLQKLK